MPRKKADAAAEPVQAEAAKKTAKKTPSILKKAVEKVEEVYLQAGGAEWNISDYKARVEDAYVAEGHRKSSIKKMVVYLKPEEGKAYFVINDSVNGSIDL